ncbi:MAG: histidinol-phosphatase [Ruminococcaceae bacterium]|nr:histidinol-phosphatase [Oscillospiraceae bacterium]
MKCNLTTDFHSHILPGADHGSRGIEVSVKQLDLIASYGIKRVVATPHFYPERDNVDSFLERRTECARLLKANIREGHPDVFLGAEVLVCDGIERMEGLEKLTVYGTNCILLEMPMTKWSIATFETIEAIRDMGLVPVMAHVDRYKPKYVEELLSLGVKAQLNPDAFSGFFNKKNSMRWLSEGRIVALGSDLHGADEKCYRTFASATRALGKYTEAAELSMKELLRGAKMLSAGAENA